MRATGIVRRVDDLGRVVIPKEVRRNLGIREGDPLELYVENDRIIWRKYRPQKNIADCVNDVIRTVEGYEEDYTLSKECSQKVKDKLMEIAELLKEVE